MSKRPWCALAVDWYNDAKLDNVVDDHPVVLGLWPMLVAMSTAASHVTRNPTGRLEVSTGRLARYCRVDKPTMQAALDALEQAGLIEQGSHDGDPVIGLTRWDKWQQPVGSHAYRKRQQRHTTPEQTQQTASHAETPDLQGLSQPCPSDVPHVSHPPAPAPTPIEKETAAAPTPSAPAHVSAPPRETAAAAAASSTNETTTDTTPPTNHIIGARRRLGPLALQVDELDGLLQTKNATPGFRWTNLWRVVEVLKDEVGADHTSTAIQAAVRSDVSTKGVKAFLLKVARDEAGRAAERKNRDPSLMTAEERKQAAQERTNALMQQLRKASGYD